MRKLLSRLRGTRPAPAATVPIAATAWTTPTDEDGPRSWVIFSNSDPARKTILADCSRGHAASVAANLWLSDEFPDDVLIQGVVSPVSLEPVGPPIDLRADFQARFRRVRRVGA